MGAEPVRFKLNGTQQELNIDPNMPLLWAIRDVLRLTGTKFGCGQAYCGACTIHLDGQAIRSCITPVSVAVGKSVTTIEGLSKDDEKALHPLQKAWIDAGVPQCGYCQPGQIMSAAALLNSNKNPSDTDIDQAMSGNLCRCGTYTRIRQAIKTVAAAKRGGGK